MGMRAADPRNLEIVEGLKISGLNERTGANECKESIEVFQVGIEPSQAVVIEQLEKLLFIVQEKVAQCARVRLADVSIR